MNTSKQSDFNKIKEIFKYFKSLKKYIYLSSIAITATVLLSLPVPYLNMKLVDEVLIGKDYQAYKIIILVWGILLFIIPFANSIKSYFLAIFDLKLDYFIRKDIVNRIVYMPLNFFINNQSGYIQSRIDDDVNNLHSVSAGRILEIFSDSIKLVFGLIMMLSINVKLTIISLMIIPLTLINNYIFSKRVKKVSKEVSEAWAVQRGNIFETLFGIETVKLFVFETKKLLDYTKKYEGCIKITAKKVLVDITSGYLNTVISGLAPLIIWSYGGWLIINNQLTIGNITAFVGYIAFVFGPAINLASLKLNVQAAIASWERIKELLNFKDEMAMVIGKPDINISQGDVAFKNVSYCFEGQEEYILKDINFHISASERIAILGGNGAGKSTLIRLLLQIFTGYTGQIYIDGQDISEYSMHSLRRQITIVSQDVFIFDGTILENIRLYNEKISYDEVMEIIHKINLDIIVSSLSDGLNTVVQERGLNLSGGQKQLISIVRALLKKEAKILIFDEATSSLDPIIEKIMCENINKFCEGKTFINIVHRSTFLNSVDRIIVLEKGQIKFEGSKEKYFEENGVAGLAT